MWARNNNAKFVSTLCKSAQDNSKLVKRNSIRDKRLYMYESNSESGNFFKYVNS